VSYAFYLLSGIAVLSALNVVVRRNPVHATLWLVACFVALAGVYAALGAEFLAAVQVFVYAGAIVVLFLFVVMLVGQRPDEKTFGGQAPVGALLALGAAGLLAAAAAAADLRALNVLRASRMRTLGEILLGPHALAFEVASLLLITALVAAVVVSRSED